MYVYGLQLKMINLWEVMTILSIFTALFISRVISMISQKSQKLIYHNILRYYSLLIQFAISFRQLCASIDCWTACEIGPTNKAREEGRIKVLFSPIKKFLVGPSLARSPARPFALHVVPMGPISNKSTTEAPKQRIRWKLFGCFMRGKGYLPISWYDSWRWTIKLATFFQHNRNTAVLICSSIPVRIMIPFWSWENGVLS